MLVLIKPGCSRFCVITLWKSLRLSNLLYCLLVLMAERFLLMSSLSVSSFSWCCCPLPACQVPLWRPDPCPLNPCPICGGVLLGAPKPPLLQAEPDPTLQPPSLRGKWSKPDIPVASSDLFWLLDVSSLQDPRWDVVPGWGLMGAEHRTSPLPTPGCLPWALLTLPQALPLHASTGPPAWYHLQCPHTSSPITGHWQRC